MNIRCWNVLPVDVIEISYSLAQEHPHTFTINLFPLRTILVRFCPFSFFQFFKGRCHGNQLKSQNRRFLQTNFICRTAIQNLIAISQFQFHSIKQNVFLYIVYTFGDIRSRNRIVYAVITTPFAAIWQKWAYHAKYLGISWTYLDLLYRFGRRIRVDNYPCIHLVVAQGTLPWQPVKFGRFSQMMPGTTFTRCSGIRQRILLLKH